MATAERAKLQYEAGQNAYAMAAMTDSGDHTLFTAAASPWSRRDAFAPIVRPNGVLTGGVITPNAAVDKVSVSAGSAWINGALVTWSAGTADISRGADANIYRTTSVIITNAGAIDDTAGTAHTGTSDTRAASGGPALIATTAIELGQVRVSSTSSAVITEAEIFTVPNVHRELALYPVWEVDYLEGEVTFAAALPASHTGPVAKGVYASYATPAFADVSIASDFRPPENSYSVSSTQVYGRTLGASSQSLNAGGFTAYLEDGVTDPLLSLAGELLWFKFFPNRYASSYIISQGRLGISRQFPAGDNISATCTINAESAAVNV